MKWAAPFWTAMLLALGTAHGQTSGVGVGVDGALWAAGWQNVHVALPVHDEIRLHLGVGFMGSSDETVALTVRQRPDHFDQASILTLGVRAYPHGMKRTRFTGLIGLEYAEESFRTQRFPGTSEVGRMEWVRTDIRGVLGVEWRPVSRVGLNVHAGVGHSAVRGTSLAAEFVPRHGERSPFTRMIGTELLFWF
ncbi:MAG: hypothetical protein CBC74_004400 [Crocinitomicaceae bacterium TMED114]|nr:MAG: hypothetical protein CBC74_004400 [Crocinitomicaceae bacterium TMED114]